ncbi:MAG TPA: NADH-quinone oxidoreductase subunit J [Chloroflexota bacterium]|nr:NADH-quinone oxidoreductase subunit J [Chloroflexota bacterium]
MTEIIANIAFWVFAIVALAGAFGTVMARRIFHNALFLVVALSSVAAIYVLLSADFLAAVQVLVYTGAIVILMLFAIMLTPQQVELPALAAGGQRLAAGVLSVVLFLLVTGVIYSSAWPLAARPLDQPTSMQIGAAMLTTYIFPFELASVLLVATMIGAILLARED